MMPFSFVYSMMWLFFSFLKYIMREVELFPKRTSNFFFKCNVTFIVHRPMGCRVIYQKTARYEWLVLTSDSIFCLQLLKMAVMQKKVCNFNFVQIQLLIYNLKNYFFYWLCTALRPVFQQADFPRSVVKLLVYICHWKPMELSIFFAIWYCFHSTPFKNYGQTDKEKSSLIHFQGKSSLKS